MPSVEVTGQLADKPTRGQSSRGLDNLRTGQLAEMFDLKFGVHNSSQCYFGQTALFIRCQYSIKSNQINSTQLHPRVVKQGERSSEA